MQRASDHDPPHGQLAVRETVDQVQQLSTLRNQRSIGRADRVSAHLLGWGCVAAAALLAVVGDRPAADASNAWLWLGLIALYVLAHHTVFEAATGSAVPTQPILVAMVLTMPVQLVPAALLAAALIAGVVGGGVGPPGYRVAVESMSAWHAFGPAAVLLVATTTTPSLAHWQLYGVALLAQFAVDALVAAIRTRALGASLRELVAPMGWTFAVDAMLAPVGLAAVIAAGQSPALLILLAAPLGLIRLLAADRSAQLERAVTLGTAFDEASSEARIDPMTGIANRRGWEESILAAERSLMHTSGRHFAVVMADMDNLKRTNDTLGHQAGDDLIREAARMLVAAAPPGALVARIGGDEFGVLMESGSPADGDDMIAALRRAVAARGEADQMSISLGTASCPPCLTVGGAAAIADDAAARDKASRRAGRDDRQEPAPTDSGSTRVTSPSGI